MDKFAKNIIQSLPLAKTAQISLLDTVNFDLFVLGLQFFQQINATDLPPPTNFSSVYPDLKWQNLV